MIGNRIRDAEPGAALLGETLIAGNWLGDEAGTLERVLLVRRVAFGTHRDLLRYK